MLVFSYADSKEQEAKRQEAQDLMKLVLEKNDEVEPGRKVCLLLRKLLPLCSPHNILTITINSFPSLLNSSAVK